MFNTEAENIFYYCKYNFDEDVWEKRTEFQTKEKFVSFLSDNYEKFFGEYNFVNYTGKDIKSIYPLEENYQKADNVYFRNIIFCDSNGRIIDIRDFKEEVKKKTKRKDTRWKWRFKYPAPEPQGDKMRFKNYKLHSRSDGVYRKEKTWFHNYRADNIPEYKNYVRYKAIVPNIWCSEPMIHHEKSWKHTNKCKKQWQKNFNPHYDSIQEEPDNDEIILEKDVTLL